MRTIFRSKALYLGGLPVGKPGQECQVVLTTEGLTVSRGRLRGKWQHIIPLADIHGTRIETADKITLKRVLLVGIFAPLWRKREQCLIVSYGPPDFTSDLILAKFNAEAAQRAIVKAKI